MDANATKFCVDIARDHAIIMSQSGAQSRGSGLTVTFKEVTAWRKGKVLGWTPQLPHQEVFGLAQIEKVLDCPAIIFREIATMGAVKRLGLLERRHLFV
jgi:hypothetical protein